MSLADSAFAMLVRLVSGVQVSVDDAYGGVESGRASVLRLPPQAIFFANHSSHLDFATIWAVLPGRLRRRVRPVAAADYWGSGARGRFASRMFRPVLVARRGKDPGSLAARAVAETGASASAAAGPEPRRGTRGQLAALGAALDAGDSLVIFPEGTRGDGSELGRFHAGLAKTARAYPEVPVVPVALSNLGRILPKGGLVPVPLLGRASFLAPIAPAAEEEDAAFLERARATLLLALPSPEAEREAELAESPAGPRSADGAAAAPRGER
ncbi:hypothetical protein USB125703_00203 [Pseudoclavibacter triregionum]|nr:hypothetical protein USB125703_00203 [Pseudoclavibacter triregionum]